MQICGECFFGVLFTCCNACLIPYNTERVIDVVELSFTFTYTRSQWKDHNRGTELALFVPCLQITS